MPSSKEHVRVVAQHRDDGRTKQEFSRMSNINTIMDKIRQTGQMPPGLISQGAYGDFSSGADFFDAQLSVVEAEEAFMKLPAKVRRLFDNDPGVMLKAFEDEGNHEELRKIGLMEPLDEPGGHPQPAESGGEKPPGEEASS